MESNQCSCVRYSLETKTNMAESAAETAEVCSSDLVERTSEVCSDSECETMPVCETDEVDDVVEGSEPGASRCPVLYDNMAQLADPSYADTARGAGVGRSVSLGKIEQLKDDAANCDLEDSNSEQTTAADGAAASSRCAESHRLKPPQPIFARIDTPSSLSEEDIERQRSSAAASFFISRPADDAQQIAVLILYIISCHTNTARDRKEPLKRPVFSIRNLNPNPFVLPLQCLVVLYNIVLIVFGQFTEMLTR